MCAETRRALLVGVALIGAMQVGTVSVAAAHGGAAGNQVVAYESAPYPFVLDLLDADVAVSISITIDEDGRVESAVAQDVASEALARLEAAPTRLSKIKEAAVGFVRRWRFAPGAARQATVTYRFVKSAESCNGPATILEIANDVATLTACRRTPDHAPWSNRSLSDVAYFSELAHPGVKSVSKGTGVVYLSVDVGEDGHVRGVKVRSGPDDLAQISLENVKKWRFYDGSGVRTATIGYRFSVVEGRCFGSWAGLSGAGTLMDVVGCAPE